jgi:HAD superfamily hydrolase (TIGR01490 family)
VTTRAERAGRASARAATRDLPGGAPEPPVAAFFDVDNTLLRGASLFHVARGMYRRHFFTRRQITRFARQQLRFRMVGREETDVIAAVQAAALAFVAGHRVEELVTLGEEIFDEVIARKIWPGTRSLIAAHLKSGTHVWLVTATPVEVAEVIARRLGLTGALGTVSESVDGVYTGRLVGQPLHGVAKAEAVRALAEREGLDLAACSAYSDSINDLPMLSAVGYPCAINPDRALRAYARAHGWPVYDYRTGRKFARLGLPVAAGLGATAGGTAAAVAARRRGR